MKLRLSSVLLSLLSLPIIPFFFSPSVFAHSDDEPYYKCAPFSCGKLANISYPFWGNTQPDYCGLPGFRIDCNQGVPTLDIMSLKYHVIDVNHESQILTMSRIDLSDNICPAKLFNTTLNLTLFSYTSRDENATLLYDCEVTEPRLPNAFNCHTNNIRHEGFLVSPTVKSKFTIGCNISILVPVLERAVAELMRAKLTVMQVLNQGFEVRWITDQIKCIDCAISCGRCGYNSTLDQFRCFCPDQVSPRTCPTPLPPASQIDPVGKSYDEARSGMYGFMS